MKVFIGVKKYLLNYVSLLFQFAVKKIVIRKVLESAANVRSRDA